MDDYDSRIDKLDDCLDEFQEEVGINDDLIKIAGLENKEVSVLTAYLLYLPKLSEEENMYFKKCIRKVLLAFYTVCQAFKLEKENSKSQIEQEKRKRKNVIITICILLLLGAFLSFSKDFITADPIDGSVWWVKSKYWGISEEWKEVKWMKTSDYEYEAWMAKDKNGHWYPAITD